jgi:23S rRNA (uracil1939-C5)-methyltransferase
MMSVVVRAEKMAAGGDAIAHAADGRVMFVRGALPDETVTVEITQTKKDFLKAEVVEIIEPSVFRVEPPCPAHAAGCGGCPWQHVSAPAQLDLKAAVVTEALRRTGKIADPRVVLGASVPPWAYRTTLRVATSRGSRLGLRGHHSHEVIELDGCPVSHPLLEDLLRRLQVRGEGEVSLRVGAASGERSVWVADGDVELVDVPGDVAVGPAAVVHETIGGNVLRVSAPSFFQSGPHAAELLVAGVRDACGDLGAIESCVDAYGGVGLLAAAVEARRITVVESSAAACADAAANLGGRHVEIVCSTVERWSPVNADVVIADPSRTGLGRNAVATLAATNAARVVLVSCDPVSLARDAGLLRDAGYAHVRSTVYDLFPQTPHVEVITVFERSRRLL